MDEETRTLIDRWKTPRAAALLDELVDRLRNGESATTASLAGSEDVDGNRDLRGAPLGGRQLGGANLEDWSLDFADLTGADLAGARLQDATLSDADLSGADLRGADLRGAWLVDASLRGADLRDADLRHATLVGADLRDANLEGADLRFVKRERATPEETEYAGAGDGPLELATEALYRYFSRYPAPSEVEMSPVLGLEDQARALHRAALRSIDSTSLWPYAFHALSTWGGVSELKHFLPRIFELAWREPGWADPNLLVAKLAAAEWRTWPEEEQRAVESFLEAWFDHLLATEGWWDQSAQLLEGIAQVDASVTPWLTRWSRTRTRTATLHIANLIDWERDDLWKRGRVSKRWVEPARSEVTAWLRSAAIASRIESAYLSAPDAPFADMLASASDVLSMIPDADGQ